MSHDVKSIRKKFAAQGVFYTTEALARLVKAQIPDDATEVYDPTCGGGALLAVFDDSVRKYGQEIDAQQAAECAARLTNARIETGDTLTDPKFRARRFKYIVANPPFSIRYEPDAVYRFDDWPGILPPPSKADYAFLLHILSMLDDGGIASVVEFPGILYRGKKEGQLREWMVRNGYVERVVLMRGDCGYFVDTSINTVLMKLRKNRTERTVTFAVEEYGTERTVDFGEIEGNGFNLSPTCYISPPKVERPPVDPKALESAARAGAIRNIRAQLKFSKLVAEMEGWGIEDFLDEIHDVINEFRNQKTLF